MATHSIDRLQQGQLVDAFNLGSLANGLRFHLQLAYACLASPPDSRIGVRHWHRVDEAFDAMGQSFASSTGSDTEPLLSVVAKTQQRLVDLRSSEDYFYDIAQQLHDLFHQHGGRLTSFQYFESIIQDHAEPLAESLRSGLRAAMPSAVQPYFDLGHWFDQGWRRPDAYQFLLRETGWPLLLDYTTVDLDQAWNGWEAIGVDAGKLPTTDATIPDGSLPEQQGGEEIECEIDLSDDADGECESAGEGQEQGDQYLVTRDLPPGSLAPTDEWLGILQKRSHGVKLDADPDIALLCQAHASLRAQRLSRDAWLAALAKFRATLCDRLRLSFPVGHLPWNAYERDVWIYQLSHESPDLTQPQIARELARHIQKHDLNWTAITGSGISEALTRVRDHLGDLTGKRGRGRPRKAK